jgi:hypothetical protein
LASYSLALGLFNADPSNAVANIQQILANAQQQQQGGGTGTNSLLSALSGLGG